MATTAITRKTIARAAAVALVVGALASPAGAAGADDAARQVSPATAERLSLACIDGAPTTPDSHERWVASCHEHAAAGLS